MSEKSFSIDVQIKESPKKVFSALTVHVNQWWTEHSNTATKVGDVLTVEFEDDTTWVMELLQVDDNSRILWRVVSAQHNLAWLVKKDEWQDTEILWQIEETDLGCKVSLTHNGLTPSLECYEICNDGWQYFLGSLKQFLETGKGHPFS